LARAVADVEGYEKYIIAPPTASDRRFAECGNDRAVARVFAIGAAPDAGILPGS